MQERIKPLYEIVEIQERSSSPEDLECYQNHKGHWVWVEKGSFRNPYTFGVKARHSDVEPRLLNNVWYWVRVYGDRDREDLPGLGS